VLQAIENIKETAHWEVDVELDLFHAKSGANHMVGGLFKGKTLVYSDLNHIVLRISPKYAAEATENAILVSSHIDTVFSAYVSQFHTVVFKIYLYFYLSCQMVVIIDTSVCYKCCSESRILLMLSLFFLNLISLNANSIITCLHFSFQSYEHYLIMFQIII